MGLLTSATLGGFSGEATGSYSASYDAAGSMTCHAATSATSCAGASPNGALLTWDNEGRLTAWQNAASSPTSSAPFLYDGEGNRVQQVATTSGTTTTTSYLGGLEEVSVSGATTTTTAYYGKLVLSVNGALSYTLSDNLGSVAESLNASGMVTATQLYSPYGGVRYSSGALPTSYGYTHQRSDAVSGLDYYGARYYDPTAGQFTSADPLSSAVIYKQLYGRHDAASAGSGSQSNPSGDTTRGSGGAQPSDAVSASSSSSAPHNNPPTGQSSSAAPARDGLNAFAYVRGNPETFTDPTGKWTFGFCGTAGAGTGIGASGQACYVVGGSADGHTLSLGTTETGAAGGVAGETGGVTGGIQFSNANSVHDLKGPFVYGGFGFQVPIVPIPVGFDINWF